jgi:hypothetical protein
MTKNRTSILAALLTLLIALTLPAQRQRGAVDIKADAYVTGSWNGVLFVVDDTTGFLVRIGTRTEGGNYLDGDVINPFLTGIEDLFNDSAKKRRASHPSRTLPHFYESVTEIGPHSPDGSYARLVWNPLYPYDTSSRFQLEWARTDPATLLGKLTYRSPVNFMSDSRSSDVVLEAYSPLGYNAEYQVRDGAVLASSRFLAVTWKQPWNAWKFHFSSDDLQASHEAEAGQRAGFEKDDFDDSKWQTVRWGSYWQEDPFIPKKGYGWYRVRLTVPSQLKGKTLRLNLGKVRQQDWTYLNGELVGQTSGADVKRLYTLPPEATAYKKIRWDQPNTLAVQVFSGDELGGIAGGPYGRTPDMLVVRRDPSPQPALEVVAPSEQTINFVLVGNRPVDQSASVKSVKDIQTRMQEKWELGASDGTGAVGLLFADLHAENFKRPRDNELYFVAKVGFESQQNLLSEARSVLSKTDLSETLPAAAAKYEAQRITTLGGIAGSAEIISNTLHWATIYSPEQRRYFVVDSRRWFLPDSWSLFGNSAVLTASSELEDETLAENTLKGILVDRLPDGRVMNGAGRTITTPDRSEDMYASYAAWKIYQRWGNKQFLREVYPLIKGWHEWWFADRGDGQPWRDGNRDGLLELGSNMSPFDTPQASADSEMYGAHHQAAMWESGYDDSPMWGFYERGVSVHPKKYRGQEGVRYVFKTGTLNLNTTLTNGLWALSADMLVRIARELGYGNDERRFREEYERIKKRINEVLWDPGSGMYLNRLWAEDGGQFSYRKSPVMFYMLAAQVASPEQAQRLVYEHLLNPNEFWGEYVLPTISRDDPAYPEQYYWRGNIWPPMNYFTYEGLKRYGYDAVAAQLAEKTYQLIKKNWDSTGAIWENYNSITGEGDSRGIGASTKHYSWSAALPLMPIMECIDTEAWGSGLRFGSVGLSQESRVMNWKIRGASYEVAAGPQLTELRRDGHRLFSAASGLVVREFESTASRVSFRYKTSEKTNAPIVATIGGLTPGHGSVPVRIDGKDTPAQTGAEVFVLLPAGEHSVELVAR